MAEDMAGATEIVRLDPAANTNHGYTPDSHFISFLFYFTVGLWWAVGTASVVYKYVLLKPPTIHRTGTNADGSKSITEIDLAAINKDLSKQRYNSSVPIVFCCGPPRCHHYCMNFFQPILFILYALLGTFRVIVNMRRDADGKGHVSVSAQNFPSDENGEFSYMKMKHLTVFVGFFFYSLVVLLSQCIPYPKRTSQFAFCLAMLTTAIIYVYHDLGNTALESTLHKLIAINAFIITFLGIVRCYKPFDMLVNGVIALMFLLMGTWFFQISYMMAGPFNWDQFNDNDVAMLVVCYYLYHGMAILLIVLVVYTVMLVLVRFRGLRNNSSNRNMYQSLPMMAAEEDRDEVFIT